MAGQPENDAIYTPASEDRNQGEAGAYNPVEKVTVAGIEFTVYDEPIDQENFIEFMADAVAKRMGVTRMDGQPMNSDQALSFVGYYETDTVDNIVRHKIGIAVLN